MDGLQYNGERDIIKELSVLLRDKGELILNGRSKLSLTASSVAVLNVNFRSVNQDQDDEFLTSFDVLPPNSPKLPRLQDIQFLYDMVQKTPSLKLVHGSHTLQGRVSLAVFRSLRSLELKKTPVHLLEGIHKLRSKVQVLISTRCLNGLHVLLESCGGDMSTPMSWSKLHTASFRCNTITQLDSSLRLLPVLEVLDLSYNNITNTENYLEYLTEIQIVSLNYNQMLFVPSFSLSGRTKLQTLLLRNNHLESLQGIEELTALRELDLAYNCLCEHADLAPLKSLTKLKKIKFEGNPLWYDPKHRRKTLHYIFPGVIRNLCLDKKLITQREFEACKAQGIDFEESSVKTHSGSSESPVMARHLPHISISDLDQSSCNLDETEELLARPSVQKKKGKHKRIKKKVIHEIQEQPVGGEYEAEVSYPSSCASTPRDPGYLEVRETYEKARNVLGADWLQYLAHNKAATGTGPADEEDLKSYVRPKETDDDIYLNANDSEKENQEVPTTEIEVVPKIDIIDTSIEVHSAANAPDEEIRSNSCSSEIGLYDQNAASSEEEDFDEESAPLIVYHMDQGTDSQLLISVAKRYIVEKSLMTGKIDGKLDLRAIKTVEVDAIEEALPTNSEINRERHVVHITFPDLLKSQRERYYVMEDYEDAQLLENLLLPALQANRLKVKPDLKMLCLKCNLEFDKSKAERGVRRVSSNIKDTVAYSLDKGDLQEELLCPFCKNNLIIEMQKTPEPEQLGSNYDTPVGSPFKPGPPNKHSTPRKTTNSASNSIASSFKSIDDGESIITSSYQSLRDPPHSSSTEAAIVHMSGSQNVNFNFYQQGDENSQEDFFKDSVQDESNQNPRRKSCDRSRQDSTGSDILILRKRHSTAESDITLLSHHPSQGSISVIEHDQAAAAMFEEQGEDGQVRFTIDNTEGDQVEQGIYDSNFAQGNLSPSNSLSYKALHSMVDSMYEQSLLEQEGSYLPPKAGKLLKAASAQSFYSLTSNDDDKEGRVIDIQDQLQQTDSSSGDDCSIQIFNNYDHTYLDHRVKLFFMINIFQDNEEFECVLRCDCVPFMKEEFEAILLVTTMNIYIFKITGKESATIDPKKWTKQVFSQPISHLRFIDYGLGYQSFHIEFGNENQCFTFVLRDSKCTKLFLTSFTKKKKVPTATLR